MKANHKEYSLMVIFDDIDVTKRNDKVAELFTQGRHYNVSVIVSSQTVAYFLDPTKRSNIDGLISNLYNLFLNCIGYIKIVIIILNCNTYH